LQQMKLFWDARMDFDLSSHHICRNNRQRLQL
jgi:hypothetical protein